MTFELESQRNIIDYRWHEASQNLKQAEESEQKIKQAERKANVLKEKIKKIQPE